MRLNPSPILAVLVCITQSTAFAQNQTALPHAQITEDLRLDATTQDFPGSIRVYVSPSPSRRMFVPVSKDATIRVYDSTGKSLGTIGRKGAGPGEFASGVIYLGWKAETLWVDDGGQRRISFFAPDLRLIRTTVYPRFNYKVQPSLQGRESQTIDNISPLILQTDGAVVSQAFPVGGSSKDQRFTFPAPLLVRYPKSGNPQYLADLPGVWDARWTISVDGRGQILPFAPLPFITASANGDRVAHVSTTTVIDSGAFVLTMLKANGDTAFSRLLPISVARVLPFARDSALSAIKPQEGPPDLAKRFQEIAKDRMPKIYPGVESLVLGLDNTTWVGLHRSTTGQSVLVLNGKGNPIGTVHLPVGAKLRQASLGKIWTTQTDSDGLMSVVRYRVSGIACPTDCQ